MKQIRILVVEDETLIRNNLIQKITSFDPQWISCSGAKNGMDALEKMNTVVPDIVFTDICMPCMDGLTLAKEIRERDASVQIVIISGYADFTYAKNALKIGVTDFLVKPVKNELLNSLMQELVGKVQTNENRHLHHLLQEAITGQAVSEELDLQNSCLLLLNIGNRYDGVCSPHERKYYQALWDRFFKYVNGYPYVPHILEGQNVHSRFLFFPASYAAQLDLPQFAAQLQAEFSPSNIQIVFCFLQQMDNLFAIAQSMYHSLKHRLIFGRNLLFDLRTPPAYPSSVSIPPAFFDQLQVAMRAKQPEQMCQLITSQFQSMFSGEHSVISIQDTMIHLLYFLQAETTSLSPSEFYHIRYCLTQRLLEPSDPNETAVNLGVILSPLFPAPMPEQETAALLEQIHNFILENYRTDINLETISARFNFTPSYLIKLYKRHYGCTPVKQIILLRIDAAKELITANPNLDIKTIGEYVGYSDAHYFSRIFKNIVGLSPKKYRQISEEGA
jgi:two-component system response regulator YesN